MGNERYMGTLVSSYFNQQKGISLSAIRQHFIQATVTVIIVSILAMHEWQIWGELPF
jgi:hypothetical protein